ncbi:hypothetical protein [Kitasatospora sp. NPDC093679]|uniref:hypothetical protein n=1 Tax=Kitasatospora sp. NPDC093679 TaxID=3154983 RepID=UPI00342075CD
MAAPVLVVDFGTSSSAAAVVADRGERLVKEPSSGLLSWPSAVSVGEDGRLLVGSAAENRKRAEPGSYRDEFKRDLGERAPVPLGGRLTKAELYWPEHPDPLAEGRRVADRVMTAGGGTRLMYDLRPVCSLVGAAAGQLTEQDFADLTALAAVEPALLAKRAARGPYFTTRPYPDLPVPADRRARLFGLLAGYGLTLACGLVRDGVHRLPELRTELDRRSGLADFRLLLADHFGARADLLKLRRIVDRAHTLPALLPPATDAAAARDRAAVDRAVGRFVDLEVQQHAFRELTVLRDCYDGRLTGLSDPDRLELRRVAGEYGTDPAARLGLPAGTPRPELHHRAVTRLAHWAAMTAEPAHSGPDRRACQVLRRSLERLVGDLASP